MGYMATQEHIDLMQGWRVEGSEIEVEVSRLDAEGRLKTERETR
jgi:hypothetical protein